MWEVWCTGDGDEGLGGDLLPIYEHLYREGGLQIGSYTAYYLTRIWTAQFPSFSLDAKIPLATTRCAGLSPVL